MDALVHASNRKFPNSARDTVMRSLVRLETRPTVLALLISFSGRDEARRVIARLALVGSRVAVLSFVAAGASGSSSVLVLSTSTGNADGVASLVGVEPLCALSARSVAARSQLEPPDRASNALTLPNFVIRHPRNALQAGRGANLARIGSNHAAYTLSRAHAARKRPDLAIFTIRLRN